MELSKGQKMIRKGIQRGKPPIAYIVSDPNGLHIFLSNKLKGGNHFAVHSDKIHTLWKPASIQKKRCTGSPEELTGKQGTIFPKKRTVREIWRDKTIKQR